MANSYNSTYTGDKHDTYVLKQDLIDLIYPIGAVYISVNNTNPGTLFGGTWEQIQDRFLLCAGSSYAAGTTGGEATHTLTQAETPAHTHTRGTMNITGAAFTSHSQGICYLNVAGCSGAFYGTTNVTNCGKVAVNGTFSGAAALGLDASRSWTGATSSVGGNEAHNNMPPYLSVYVWKRIE